MTTSTCRALAAAAAAAALTGCGGSDRVQVGGTVTYGGAPVDNGTITFVPADGEGPARPKASTRIADGKYRFEPDFGPVPGRYRVEITWDKKTGRKVSTGDADKRDETKQVLPAKFNAQSELTAEVRSGSGPVDFDLPK